MDGISIISYCNSTSSQWKMASGTMLLRSILLIVALMTSCQAASDANCTCPESWTQYGGNCYRYYDNAQTWDAANSICKRNAATLPTVHCYEQNKYWLMTWRRLWNISYENVRYDMNTLTYVSILCNVLSL